MNQAPSPDYLGKNRIDIRDVNQPNIILGSIPIRQMTMYRYSEPKLFEVGVGHFETILTAHQDELPFLREIPGFMEYIPAMREAGIH